MVSMFFNRIPIAWMRLKAKRWLACRKNGRVGLCLRNFWSIYWWANDGDWTRAWWIHNPLPWSTWLHPPLPPNGFQSLSTIRSFHNPYDRYQREAFSYTIYVKSILSFHFWIRFQPWLQQSIIIILSMPGLQRLGCSLHWFDFTLLLIQIFIKIGGRRAVKAHLVDSERAASTYSYPIQQA